MGGLFAGLCLNKYAPDVHFDIYEAATELTELGAGITMSPRTWTLIIELGLAEELLPTTGTQAPTGSPLTFVKGDEDPAVDVFELSQHMTSSAAHALHRPIVQQVLTKHIGADDRIHLSKCLTSYFESSPGTGNKINLHFKDGTTATCGLVIGCDGIRSAVRRTMFNDRAQDSESRGKDEEAARMRDMVKPVYSGQIAYRGLAPASALSEAAFRHTHTPQLDIIIYPVAGGKSINLVAVKYIPEHDLVYDGPWVESTTWEAIVELFKAWQPWALETIMAIETPFRWAMHTVRELPRYVHGRVALIRDAGAGAGQAFEDGFVLSLILSSPSVTLSNLPAALKIYDDLRRPFSQGVQRASERCGANYHWGRAGSGWENVSEEDTRTGRYPGEPLPAIGEDIQG